MERKPAWIRAERVEREATFELNAGAGRIFPLLCPVREYEWIPSWRCEMLYSDSGLAEKDAIFRRPESFGRRAVWCCVVYEPPRLIEYLVVLGLGMVTRLTIRLEELPGGSTRVAWTMLFTLSGRSRRRAARHCSQAGFDALIAARKKELEGFLA
jgi:hypothetical protein